MGALKIPLNENPRNVKLPSCVISFSLKLCESSHCEPLWHRVCVCGWMDESCYKATNYELRTTKSSDKQRGELDICWIFSVGYHSLPIIPNLNAINARTTEKDASGIVFHLSIQCVLSVVNSKLEWWTPHYSACAFCVCLRACVSRLR